MRRLEQDEQGREAEIVELIALGWTATTEDGRPLSYSPRCLMDSEPFLYGSENDAEGVSCRYRAHAVRTHARVSASV